MSRVPDTLAKGTVQGYLMVILIVMVVFTNIYIRKVEEKVDTGAFVTCQALNDARSRAFQSLIGNPGAQAREVGKINRSMALLTCEQHGFEETVVPR